MKFGHSFHQRSIPGWSVHNIDYNDLKQEVKRRTSKDNGQAQAIPGTGSEANIARKFEDDLYTELQDQHERVDLFVRSKSDAISRQLTHLQKQVAQLERQNFSLGQQKISVRQLEKFSKLEDQILEAGSEIQSLVRFANANRLALQKLVKKYRKWTGSAGLGERFRREILTRTSNLNSNFEFLFAKYVGTLAAVRAPFGTGINWHAETSQSKARSQTAGDRKSSQSTSASHLNDVAGRTSHTELDTALATSPLGQHGARAVYWVHPEYVVQLQILLLQSTRIRNWIKSPHSTENGNSLRSSRRGSVSGHAIDCVNTGGQDAGLLICDDLQQLAARQSSEPIGESETSSGTTAEKAAASLRFSQRNDLFLAVSRTLEGSGESQEKLRECPYDIASLKKKNVRTLFDHSSQGEAAMSDTSKDSEHCTRWLASHPEVKPLVQIHHKRSHFAGIRNTETAGSWATLDTDVYMRRSAYESLSSKDQDWSAFDEDNKNEWERFPFAILQVRLEGRDASGLLATLDTSHLITRIRGFSLEAHAVATLCKPQGMPPPHWLPRLNEDLRNLPKTVVVGRIPKKAASPDVPTRETSISAPSTRNGQSSGTVSAVQGESSATSVPEQLANPPLSAFKKKRKSTKRRRLPTKELRGSQTPSNQRYWNEFDDGSEGEQAEPYTIFIDPNAPSTFPGGDIVSKAFASLLTNSKVSWEKAHSWMSSYRDITATPDEERPLINGTHSPSSPGVVDSSDSENDTAIINARRSYSTIASHHHNHLHHARSSHESLLFRTSLGCFAAAIVIIIIQVILVTTSRRKAATEVDIGVVICVAASLVFTVMGVGSMLARYDRVGWVHRSAVAATAILVILANSLILFVLSKAQISS